MLKNGIKPSAKANCQEQAEGLTVEPAGPAIIETTNKEDENTEEIAQYLKLIAQPSSFHDDVLFYIAGFICRKLVSSLKLTICLSAVATRASQCDLRDNTAVRLTLRKYRDDLMAYNDIFLNVKTADRVLQKLILTNCVLTKKCIEHDPLRDDHRLQIIKRV